MRFHPPQTVSNAALQAFSCISSPDQQRVGDSGFLPVESHFIMSDEQRVSDTALSVLSHLIPMIP
jgi:hypothetical protein